MADFITLTCPSCGAKLQITNDVNRFACSSCGNEHVVNRIGGIITLQPIIDSIKGVIVGVDKTASELAIVRLNQEIPELEIKYHEAVLASDNATRKARYNKQFINERNDIKIKAKEDAEQYIERIKCRNYRQAFIYSMILILAVMLGSLLISKQWGFSIFIGISGFVILIIVITNEKDKDQKFIQNATPDKFVLEEPDKSLIEESQKLYNEAIELKNILASKKMELENHQRIVSSY